MYSPVRCDFKPNEVILHNDFLERRWEPVNGVMRTTLIKDLGLAGEYPVEGTEFSFDEFTSADGQAFKFIHALPDTMPDGSEGIRLEYLNPNLVVTVAVLATLSTDSDLPLLRKWLRFSNNSGQPRTVQTCTVEDLTWPETVTPGGRGQIVFLGDGGFAGLEHPCAENLGEQSRLRLTHHPQHQLYPGQSFLSRPAIICLGATTPTRRQEVLDRYIHSIMARRPTWRKVYCTWGIHDHGGDGIWLTVPVMQTTLAALRRAKKFGFEFDDYLLDAGLGGKVNSVLEFTPARWPDQMERVLSDIRSLCMQPGVWVDLSRPLEDKEYREELREVIVNAVSGFQLSMLKLDFCSWAGREATVAEKNADYLIEIIKQARAAVPQAPRLQKLQSLFVLAHNGFPTSIWWLPHFDAHFVLDPQPSTVPAPRLRQSIHLRTDSKIREFHQQHHYPFLAIDDHGVMLGHTETIYWLGKENWRDNYILNLCRGNLKPFIYGDVTLLDDTDMRFLEDMKQWAKAHQRSLEALRWVGGEPEKGEIYGYSGFASGQGFILLNNPSFEERSFTFRIGDFADKQAFLTPDGIAEDIFCFWLRSVYPRQEVLTPSSGTVCSLEEQVTVVLRPWELLLLEMVSELQPGTPIGCPYEVDSGTQPSHRLIGLPGREYSVFFFDYPDESPQMVHFPGHPLPLSTKQLVHLLPTDPRAVEAELSQTMKPALPTGPLGLKTRKVGEQGAAGMGPKRAGRAGYATEDELLVAWGARFDKEIVRVGDSDIPAEVLELVDGGLAGRGKILPIALDGNVLRVATADPLDVQIMGDVEQIMSERGLKVVWVLCVPDDLEAALRRLYKGWEVKEEGPLRDVLAGLPTSARWLWGKLEIPTNLDRSTALMIPIPEVDYRKAVLYGCLGSKLFRFETTPRQGTRHIWSGCNWTTFHLQREWPDKGGTLRLLLVDSTQPVANPWCGQAYWLPDFSTPSPIKVKLEPRL